MEVSRKHGAFDTRWPRARSSAATPMVQLLQVAEAAESLAWDRFSARHFREVGRHNSEARSAYAAYKRGHEWRKRPSRLRLATEHVGRPVELKSKETGTRRLLAAIAALGPDEAQARVPLAEVTRREHE